MTDFWCGNWWMMMAGSSPRQQWMTVTIPGTGVPGMETTCCANSSARHVTSETLWVGAPLPCSPSMRSCYSTFGGQILDAFWARDAGTIPKTVSEIKRMERSAVEFDLGDLSPVMGPFPTRDVQGMRYAVAMLDRSNDKGTYESRVQPETYRKQQAALTNIYQASVEGIGDTLGVKGEQKMWVSNSPHHSLWYGSFMKGLKFRTGAVVKQDKAITIEVLKAALEILEERREAATTPVERMKASRMGAWCVGGFTTGLRGEEHLIVELAGTARSMRHLEPSTRRQAYWYFHLSGKTKNNREQGNSLKVPAVDVTKGSQLEAGKWVKRCIEDLRACGFSQGCMFSTRNGAKSRLADFTDEFMEVLEAVQDRHPDLIPPDLDVRKEYGILRSLRRGVSSHAMNMKVDAALVNMIHRWRDKKDAKKSKQPQSMLHRYTDLEALLPTLLRYSRAL